ncbi:MAG: sugar transferase [Deltaproteobacteria bacterium]|jgi:O-antigen biosynthesis protein WbqP|nr:sugar transferase [Deltaproteobacteria bacterium]
MYRLFFKRFIDVTASLLVGLLLSPLLLVIALLLKVFDSGPIIFRHRRIGRGGREFDFYKFRSMPVNTGDIPSDQLGNIKLTWIGKFIRRTNIDELPQLFNIFKGDMSIVGPRPPIPNQLELIALRRSNGALACRPGLTGLAQVNSFDGMSVPEKAAFDAEYAAQISFLKDTLIVLRTVGYLFKPPPKY